MSSTGVMVQSLRNTDRRRCFVTVEQHTSPCQSSGVGTCWCQRWTDTSARYVCTLPDRHWKTRTATLSWTRCHTGKQCSCRKIWSQRHAPVTSELDLVDLALVFFVGFSWLWSFCLALAFLMIEAYLLLRVLLSVHMHSIAWKETIYLSLIHLKNFS